MGVGVRYQRKFAAFLFTCIFTGPVAIGIQAAQTTTYSYDVLGRVATVCFVESGRLITYSYDSAGNRTAIATTGTSCGGGTTPPPNQPPVAVDDTINLDLTVFDTVQVNVLANDSDPDGDSLTVTDATCVTTQGCIVLRDGNILNVIGTTEGSKTLTYTISDGRRGTDSATVIVKYFNAGAGCEDSPILCFPSGPGGL